MFDWGAAPAKGESDAPAAPGSSAGPNCSVLPVTRYELSEVLGQNCRLLQGPETDYTTVQQIRKALQQATSLHVNILNYRKDKTKFQNNFMLIPLTSGGKNLYYVGIQDCPEEIR